MTYRVIPGYGDKYRYAEDPVTTLTNTTDLIPAPQIGTPKQVSLEQIGKVKDGELKPVTTVPVTFYDKNRTILTESEANSPISQAKDNGSLIDNSPQSTSTKEDFMMKRVPQIQSFRRTEMNRPKEHFKPKSKSGIEHFLNRTERFNRNSRTPLNSMETLGKFIINSFTGDDKPEGQKNKVEKFCSKNWKTVGTSIIVLAVLIVFCLSALCILAIIRGSAKTKLKTIMDPSKKNGGKFRLSQSSPLLSSAKLHNVNKVNTPEKHVEFRGLTPSELKSGGELYKATLSGGGEIF